MFLSQDTAYPYRKFLSVRTRCCLNLDLELENLM